MPFTSTQVTEVNKEIPKPKSPSVLPDIQKKGLKKGKQYKNIQATQYGEGTSTMTLPNSRANSPYKNNECTRCKSILPILMIQYL